MSLGTCLKAKEKGQIRAHSNVNIPVFWMNLSTSRDIICSYQFKPMEYGTLKKQTNWHIMTTQEKHRLLQAASELT